MAKKKTLTKKYYRENNKLMVILFLLLGFALVMAYMSIDMKASKKNTRVDMISAVNSSTVTIPETSFAVTLVDGKGEFSDSTTEGFVQISEPYYSVNSDGGYDAFAVMTYSTGENGEFFAVALFQTKDGKAVYRGSYPVGERVGVKEISKISGDQRNYVISVNYMDRSEDESMVKTPGIDKTLTFNVDSHRITTPALEN